MSRRRWGLAAASWYVLILALTLPARVAEEMPSIPHLDKGAHAAAFAVQAILLALAMGNPVRAWVLTGLLGAADEGLQALVPGRTCELADWIANVVGASSGLLWLTFRRRPRDVRPQ